jgi:3D (Asp-Asp-Asp) domain-containing protein
MLALAFIPAWAGTFQGQQSVGWPLGFVAAQVVAPDGVAHAADDTASSIVVSESWIALDDAWDGSERYARVVRTGPSGLRVRTGPSAEHSATVILKEGAVVRVVETIVDSKHERWVHLAGDEGQLVDGWSSATYLSPLSRVDAVPGPDGPAQQIVLGRILTVKVTAYTYQVPGNGAHGWITKSGDLAEWGVVAVDPRIIPLGATLAIDGYDRLFVASDTGYAINGHHVDIFFHDWWTAARFGVQQRDVIVYE